MNTVWKPAPGYSCYEVSETGDLRCVRFKRRMRSLGQMEPSRAQGYRRYALVDDRGFQRTKGAHRLVAMAFLPPPDDPAKTYLLHRNGLRCCTHWSNLRWGSASENSADMIRHGQAGAAILKNHEVVEIRTLSGNSREIGKCYGVNWRTIESIWSGKAWQHLTTC